MSMDAKSIQNIRDLEAELGRPTGIGKIIRGECEMRFISPVGCTFCQYGHMLECHFPKTCEEARCGHYLQEEELNETP